MLYSTRRKHKKHHKPYKPKASTNQRIGIPTGFLDKNKVEIKSGDYIQYGEYKCIVLWNYGKWEAMILYSQWYGDDEFDCNSYGKSLSIPTDNGARMEIEILNE